MKLVKEILCEKFAESGDPISDMSIGIKSMSIKQVAELTVRTFKPFGITVYYRTYRDDAQEVAFDLYDSISEKELYIHDFNFFTDEGAKMYLGEAEEGGWFIAHMRFTIEKPTYNLNEIINIVLREIYGDKEAIIEQRIKYLENVKNFYKENI